MALASSFSPPPSPPVSSGCRSTSPIACARAQPATDASPSSSRALKAILDSKLIACLRAQDFGCVLWHFLDALGLVRATVFLEMLYLRNFMYYFNTIAVGLFAAAIRRCLLHNGNTAMEAACAALSGGISVLEIVMSTPGVLEVIKGLVKYYPSSVIGVGTVLNVEDARKAVKAGAEFLMSPATVMEILFDINNSDVLYIPGAMTPTELLVAYSSGARIIKIYPVSILGGDTYISALKKPFPHIPMVASQGITTDSIRRYIRSGASAVVLSDAIFEKEVMRQRDFGEIQRLAHLATLQVHQLEYVKQVIPS